MKLVNNEQNTRCTELERTPLSDIFRGQLRSRVSRAGEQPTDNVQPFFTLQLDIEVSVLKSTIINRFINARADEIFNITVTES